MNHKKRRAVETAACERRYGIADAKGAEYSGAGETYKETGADTLRNFKAVAERLGITPEQALLGYLLKHIDSINTMVREAALEGDIPRWNPYLKGEGIVSRLDDARNYLDLLECLLIDNWHIMAPASFHSNPEETTKDDVEAAEKFIADYSPVIGVKHNPNGVDHEDYKKELALSNAGLVEGLDGVWRGATTIDPSVPEGTPKQTPIYAKPAVFEPKTETGELNG